MVSKYYIQRIKERISKNIFVFDGKRNLWSNILDPGDCITGEAMEMMLYIIDRYEGESIPQTLNPFPQG